MKKRILSIMAAAALIFACLPSATALADYDHFDDVDADAWYADAVNWAVRSAITFGTSDTEFSPDMTCTRGQVVTFLWRANGSPYSVKNENPFADVPEGSYFEEAVMWAVESGITNGTSATAFSPDEKCTRGQILTFIWRSEGSPSPEQPGEVTADWADSYYKNAVAWAESIGMLDNTDVPPEKFDPSVFCPRGLVVKYLYDASFRFVTTVDQLVNALAPCRNIILAPGEYNLTEWMETASDTDLNANPYIEVDEDFDGKSMSIVGLEHVMITSPTYDPADVSIVVEPRYANVLTLTACSDIILSDLTMGHTPEEGYCTGGVICLDYCDSVYLSNLDLYGCGTYGISAYDTDYIYAYDVLIHDCSYGGMELYRVAYASFTDCSVINCREFSTLTLIDTEADFNYCTFKDNYWGDFSDFLYIDDSVANFNSCTWDLATYRAIVNNSEYARSIGVDGGWVE